MTAPPESPADPKWALVHKALVFDGNFEVLSAVAHQPGISAGQIAPLVGCARDTTCQRVQVLEKAGLVVRLPKIGRLRPVEVTSLGRFHLYFAQQVTR